MGTETGRSSGTLQIGEWSVNAALDTISRGSESQKLEPRTMRLLLCLSDAQGDVVSVEQLLADVWAGVVVGSASVYQAVSQLRKLLGDVGTEATYIATVPRKGYRLIAPVHRRAAPSAEPAAIPATDRPKRGDRRRFSARVVGGLALAVVIATAVVWWTAWRSSTSDSRETSIVVLPFIDMTTEKKDQAFCDGLTEELSSWLSQIPTLRVVARTSSFAFRGQGEDVRKIGKALGTDHILEGSMRRSGDHVRVTVQLIDARNGYHLWSNSYDRPLEDTINMQEDVARAVAHTLQVPLTSEAGRQFAARRTADAQAYPLYLLAHYQAQQLTPESTDRAIELYRQVVAGDANFAPAYAQLAKALFNRGLFRELPVNDVATEMEPLIATALRLDDRLSAAYAIRGALRAAQSKTQEGLHDLQLAISLNSSDMTARALLGRMRLSDGHPREALESLNQAAALDPLNHTLQEQRCLALEDLARYPEAQAACDRARVLEPRLASPAEALMWLAESRGRIPEALRWSAASIRAEPTDDAHLYWARATLFLSLGLAQPAHSVIELGRAKTHDDDNATMMLVPVIFCEGGANALRHYLDAAHLEQSPHATTLFAAAYGRLLLGDAQAVKALLSSALAARDRPTGYAEFPWYARGAGTIAPSYRLDRAVAELALGERAAADSDLTAVQAMLDAMISNGVQRNATFELRAKAYALAGKGDDAMRDLNRAVQLGWRRAWWALHEPYFTSLQPRSDFQALLAQVSQSNEQLTRDLKPDD